MYSWRARTPALLAGMSISLALQKACLTWPGDSGDRIREALSLIGGFLALAAIFGVIAMHRAHVERRDEQTLRDRAAKKLIELIVSSRKPPAFVLYLRPFLTEPMLRRWTIGTGSLRTFLLDSGRMNFDNLLQEHLTYLDLALVSLGAPDDHEGAGRIATSDALWREQFHQLAERAASIVVVPGLNDGIKAEIRWLRVRGLLGNTVFFKPKGYRQAEWQRAAKFFQDEDDLEFPVFSRRHISFRLYPSGTSYEVSSWMTINPRWLSPEGKAQMRRLLTNKPPVP